MARLASGAAHIEAARQLLHTAKTAEELRRAQAVLLPLELGLSMQQTATVIGRSVGATCTIRTRFLAVREGRQPASRRKCDLRNRATATLEEEARVLDDLLVDAEEGQILVVSQIKPMIDARLGKAVSLSSVYRMLARHGWRKLAPDTAHPQGDAEVREDWKKTLHGAGSKQRPLPTPGTVEGDVSG